MAATSRRGRGGKEGGTLTLAQKNKVEEFAAIVTCSNNQARQLLEKQGWNLERAVDAFFTNPPRVIEPPDKPSIDQKKIESLFSQYSTSEGIPAYRLGKVDAIMNEDQIQDFLQFCGVAPEDEEKEHLFAWKCGALEIGILSREEFIKGMLALGCDSTTALVPLLVKEKEKLVDTAELTSFYNYLYDYVKGPAKRTLDVDETVCLWRMWLTPDRPQKFNHLDKFMAFLETESNSTPISKDLWSQAFVFFTTMDEHLSTYDPNDAWPVRIDEFIEWLKKQPSS